MKKILIFNANPKLSSFCRSLTSVYLENVSQDHSVEVIHISDLDFEMNLKEGYDQIKALEPDLVKFQEKLLWADHVVFISPVWWGAMPSKFKALIDRTFLPGFAFKYEEGKTIPKKLLSGRTAELIITLDTPVWWYKIFQGQPILTMLKHTILEFVGIKVIRHTYFGPLISSKESQREAWKKKVESIARKQ